MGCGGAGMSYTGSPIPCRRCIRLPAMGKVMFHCECAVCDLLATSSTLLLVMTLVSMLFVQQFVRRKVGGNAAVNLSRLTSLTSNCLLRGTTGRSKPNHH